jgi:hypothetical protein
VRALPAREERLQNVVATIFIGLRRKHRRCRTDSQVANWHCGRRGSRRPDDADYPAASRRPEHLKTNANWRMTTAKIINRAKVKVWPKIFQNMRASRETELVAQGFPLHVVCAWIGNSVKVAQKHYLQVTDADFEAASKTTCKTTRASVVTGGQRRAGREMNARNSRNLANSSIDIRNLNTPGRTRILAKNGAKNGAIPKASQKASHSTPLSPLGRRSTPRPAARFSR